MASITITVSTLSAEVTADNAKAQTVLNEFVAATGGPVDGANQEKLQHVVETLRTHIVDVAADERRRRLQVEAAAAQEAEVAGLAWA